MKNLQTISTLFLLNFLIHLLKGENLSNNISWRGKDREMRVLKGLTCSTDDYPFMLLLLEEKDGGGWARTCGATLLTSYFALTAAHCVYQPSKFGIMYALSTMENNVVKDSNMIFVTTVILHQDFRISDFANDIALLRLAENIEESRHVNYVALPRKMTYENEKKAPCSSGLIMGWGKTEKPEALPDLDKLQCILIPMLSTDSCRKLYWKYHLLKINPGHICTLSNEGIDVCQGDSGGPLLCGNVQVGIVSWSANCGDPQSPGVYTRVDLYMDFIQKHTGRRYRTSINNNVLASKYYLFNPVCYVLLLTFTVFL